MPPAGNRFLIFPTKNGNQEQCDLLIRELDPYTENRPYPVQTEGECLRFCFHVYHKEENIDALVSDIYKKLLELNEQTKKL